MRVLVACEFSGIVRDAFAARGHDAWSCDLLPTERPGNHIQGDVLEILGDGWDLMIAHPPCTYLSYAGTRHWNSPGRSEKREAAMSFFMEFANAKVPRIAIENPVGYASNVFRRPDQIIEPYYFGDRQKKRTCLWLINLPKLIYAKSDTLFMSQTATEKPEPISIDNNKRAHKRYFTDAISGKNRQHLRSVTFQGIAKAMAEQWG